MKLEETIHELLLFNDCVIVPQFGAFVSNYEVASIKGDVTSEFLPPSKHLIFNSKLTHNDGLLLDHIAKKMNVSFGEASSLVQKQIWDIEQSIKENGHAQFADLGTFSKTTQGSLSFETKSDSIENPESFGLGSFSFKPINNKPAIRIKKERSFQDLARRAAGSKILKPALYILPLVIAVALIKPIAFDQVQTSSLNITTETESINTIVAEEIADEEAITKHLAETSHQRSALTYSEPEYHIIVGSFQEQANAVQFMNKPIFGKVDAELLYTNDLYRVSVGNFKNKKVATKRLIEMRVRNRELKDAWVFTKQ